ncbi:MAG: precorrin-8X methylmutase [Thermoguttaceae bacterium]|jgi:precorrin-8X/cobalt-precorrin-8 methylmutase
MNGSPPILIVSHGSRRPEANQGFVEMVARVALRLGHPGVLPAFFSIVGPSIEDRVAELASQGARRIVLMPYFLHAGRHTTRDIPERLEECRRRWPLVELELLPTLEEDAVIEDVVAERLLPLVASEAPPDDGRAIQRKSFEIIDRQLAACGDLDPGVRGILRRIIHATADFSFARSLRVHPQAVAAGRAALAAGRPVICDVSMVRAGLTKVQSEVLCGIGREEVAAASLSGGCTRAAAAMEFFAGRLSGAIVVVGNAPTALAKVIELARSGAARPALVIGLPVGLVGAREAKAALAASDLVYITNVGPRGGSPVAAATLNALAVPPEEE